MGEMGERGHMPPRREREGGETQGDSSRGRVTPFRPRRADASRAPRSARLAPVPAGTGPGGVGVDLRAGRSSLPPIPSRPQREESPPSPRPAVVYTPGATTTTASSPLAAPSRPPSGQPSQHHRRTRRIALLALLCAQVLVAATTVWALTTPRFQTRRIRVAGTDDMLVVSRVQALPLTGCNIFACDTVALARQVERLPAVASATVSTVYPDGLLVRVTPRQPALVWHTSAGELVLATDGTVLGAVSDDPTFAHLALPRVEDGSAAAFDGKTPPPGARVDPLLVNMAAQLRKGIQPVLGNGWALDYDTRNGLVAVNGSGAQVLFGTPRVAAQAADDTPSVAALLSQPTAGQVAKGVRMQLAELHALLGLLAGRGQQAALIDLRWGAHPYYRLAG
ncbi:MAG TPA: FtsQ-type POTRA domain-containing protein [Ktedonobacterales bacterium]